MPQPRGPLSDAELDMEPTRMIRAIYRAWAPVARVAEPTPCPTCGGPRAWHQYTKQRVARCAACQAARMWRRRKEASDAAA